MEAKRFQKLSFFVEVKGQGKGRAKASWRSKAKVKEGPLAGLHD